jgi:hypothetical protein
VKFLTIPLLINKKEFFRAFNYITDKHLGTAIHAETGLSTK